MLCTTPLGRCRSLLPLGGRVCAGLSARPFLAARREVMLQLMRLATHCRNTWVRHLWTPARIQPPLGGCFVMDYDPRPLEGGPPLLPYAKSPPPPPPPPPWAPPKSVRLAAPQRSRPPRAGGGTRGALCLEHGAPSCSRCGSVLGHQPLLPCRTRRAWWPYPAAPPRVAPGRQVLVPQDRHARAAALSSWLSRARPASRAPLQLAGAPRPPRR